MSRSSETPVDDARVMDGLRRVVRALSASARELPAKDGVSGAQLFVMRQIATAPGLSIGELAARTLARQSAVSEVISRLVARELVVRATSAADARHVELRLTAKGKRAIAGTEPTAQEQLAQGLRAMSPAQRRTLAESLEVWLDAAGFAELPATMLFEEKRTRRSTR